MKARRVRETKEGHGALLGIREMRGTTEGRRIMEGHGAIGRTPDLSIREMRGTTEGRRVTVVHGAIGRTPGLSIREMRGTTEGRRVTEGYRGPLAGHPTSVSGRCVGLRKGAGLWKATGPLAGHSTSVSGRCVGLQKGAGLR